MPVHLFGCGLRLVNMFNLCCPRRRRPGTSEVVWQVVDLVRESFDGRSPSEMEMEMERRGRRDGGCAGEGKTGGLGGDYIK